MEGAKYRTQISSSGSVLPPFLQGSPPSTGAPLPDSRGEVGGSPSASPPGFCGPCAPALQRSRPLREDRRTARAGRPQSLEDGGAGQRAGFRALSGASSLLYTPKWSSPRDIPSRGDSSGVAVRTSAAERRALCRGTEPGRRSIASGLGPGSSEAPKV